MHANRPCRSPRGRFARCAGRRAPSRARRIPSAPPTSRFAVAPAVPGAIVRAPRLTPHAAFHLLATYQHAGKVVALVDFTGSYYGGPSDPDAAGVDAAKLLVSQPTSPAQGWEIVDILARSGAVDLIVVAGRAGKAGKIPPRVVRGMETVGALMGTAVVLVPGRK